MKIVVDAMGGDHAPGEIVSGVLDAAAENSDITVTLVGQQDKVKPLLGDAPANVKFKHASEVIGMGEDPTRGLRGKPDSSLRVGLGMVKNGEADAIISAGNTGALVGGATVPILGLGTLEGVKRPGIAIPVPTDEGFCALLDVGANKNCKPIHLLQYAVMGSIYFHFLRPEVTNPRVGLLNIGEEQTKGTDLIREAYEMFEKSGLNFVGNVEPHKMYTGKADVIVCDGFTGNMVLKMGEGQAQFVYRQLSAIEDKSETFRKGVEEIMSRFDFKKFGGAPVLGVRGIVIKCHGRSRADAVANAVRMTADFIRDGMNLHIVEGLKKLTRRNRFSHWFLKPKDATETP